MYLYSVVLPGRNEGWKIYHTYYFFRGTFWRGELKRAKQETLPVVREKYFLRWGLIYVD